MSHEFYMDQSIHNRVSVTVGAILATKRPESWTQLSNRHFQSTIIVSSSSSSSCSITAVVKQQPKEKKALQLPMCLYWMQLVYRRSQDTSYCGAPWCTITHKYF